MALWSPDGARIVTTGCIDGITKIWDAHTGRELVTTGLELYPALVDWSPEGDLLVSGYSDGTVRIYDTATGEEVARFARHAGQVVDLAWSPDGARIVSTGMDRTARVWDAVTGEELTVFRGHNQGETEGWAFTDCPSWSPAGDRVVTGGAEQEHVARIWDPVTGEELLSLSGHEDMIVGTSWSPDGAHIVTGSYDTTAKVWDATVGEELLTFGGHTGAVWDVAYSPDGRRIASGGEDGTVRIWDADSGMEVMSFTTPGAVIAVYWSPDGTQLSAGGFFNPPVIQRVWQSTQELVDDAKKCCVFRELTAAEREQFGLPPR